MISTIWIFAARAPRQRPYVGRAFSAVLAVVFAFFIPFIGNMEVPVGIFAARAARQRPYIGRAISAVLTINISHD